MLRRSSSIDAILDSSSSARISACRKAVRAAECVGPMVNDWTIFSSPDESPTQRSWKDSFSGSSLNLYENARDRRRCCGVKKRNRSGECRARHCALSYYFVIAVWRGKRHNAGA
jgi:hypothetical protein